MSAANDSSESDKDANEAVASNVDLSKLGLGEDVKIFGVDCLAGVLLGKYLA